MIYDEYWLRDEIEKVWGPHGAHIEIFNRLLKQMEEQAAPTGDQDHCPNCGSNQLGQMIPEAHREAYGGATHFRRTVGYYDRDMTLFYFCPDCKHPWHRFLPNSGKYRAWAEQAMAEFKVEN